MLDQQLVKDRQSGLLAEAERRRLACLRPREPLVRIRFTLELQLGKRYLKTADI
jgi:hypothetical protein